MDKKYPWLNDLSSMAGKITFDYPLAKLTRFRVGGPADIFFEPATKQELVQFLQSCPQDVPITILGLGSNLLIRDGGIRGAVISLKHKNFCHIEYDNDHIIAGCGISDLRVAKFAAKQGLKGFSFLSGIPGGLGGALRMNAGAFGMEMCDIFVSATAIDRLGNMHQFSKEDMGFAYRHIDIPSDYIFIETCLHAVGTADPEELKQEIQSIQEQRDGAQPKGALTGGSTFANPKPHSAWKLIDQAGMRGYRIGGAQVSEMHTNFLINTGDATAKDLETLGELVREKVKQTSGIELRWEICRIGQA